MDEDERQRFVGSVVEAHSNVSEIAFKLRREFSSRSPVLKAAVKAERELFQFKQQLQKLDIDGAPQPDRLAGVTPRWETGQPRRSAQTAQALEALRLQSVTGSGSSAWVKKGPFRPAP